MKRKIFSFAVLLCCILTGCGETAASKESPEIAQKVVFVYKHTNWAEGYQHYGYYIDNAGNRVAYDVSDQDEKYADISELVAFLESRTDLAGEPYLKEEKLYRYYEWLMRISQDYELEERSSGGADMGSYCLYGIRYDDDGKMDPVLLSGDGDWITVNTDRYAQKLAERLKR